MAQEIIRTEQTLTDADADLVRAIRKVLWEYEPLRATRPGLDVKVADGRVELTGRTRTLAMKEIAEYLIMRLPGVRAVRNDIVADPEVVRGVLDALAADAELGPYCLRVDARAGEVTLGGDVPSEAEVARALEIAGSVATATSVRSRLVVHHGSAAGTAAVAAPAS
ncbi:MAG: BON domain-containing protein [Chloroflexota bacterium]